MKRRAGSAMGKPLVGISLLLLCFLSFTGCSGEEEMDIIDKLEQESKEIRAFLADHSLTAVTAVPFFSRNDQVIDSVFIFNNYAVGTRVDELGYVLYDYSISRLDGSLLDAGRHDAEIIGDSVLYLTGGPLYHYLDTAKRFDYLGEAFKHIAEGEQGEMVIPSVLMNKNGIPRHYKLRVHRVIPDLFAYEKELIRTAIADLGQTGNEIPYGEGDTLAYTVITTLGTGTHHIAEEDTVSYYSQTYFLDELYLRGEHVRAFQTDTVSGVFRESRLAFPAYGQAFKNLKEGDVAEIFIPYFMGYGTSNTYDNSRRYVLFPAYSTLGIHVEIVEVRPKAEEE